jgi:D-glycero-alpha-D-manno-heptose-7-phosphate kinase
MNPNNQSFIVNSTAPVRICDLGGWTDTWFAKYGQVINIGVSPLVEVQIAVSSNHDLPDPVVIHAENYGDRYPLPARQNVHTEPWHKHPLLEAAIEFMCIPESMAVEVTIYSQVPGGASTGTSAAVTVALIGGLDYLTDGRMSPHEVAYTAQQIETEILGQQCGVQDQLCSAYGGINYIEIFDYPRASVSPISVSPTTLWELERRLALIYLGSSHNSSQVHEMVISELAHAGPNCRQLENLRKTAPKAREALYAGDFQALGAAMRENTEMQRQLHPSLVSKEAEKVIEICQAYGALGWKVNGAGGMGGSLTLLCSDRSDAKRSMIREIEAEHPSFQNIPVQISPSGLRVWRNSLDPHPG